MRAIGLILAGGSSARMKELTKNRATAALPIAGGYRSIDFVLSSMSSSRINKVGVITQYNSKSLTQHLNSSKWWDFGRKKAVCLYSHRHRPMTIVIGTAEPQMPLRKTLIS